ncbi:MAG: peptidoglycan-binding protein LysM [Geminicoccaceae bacterium]
MGLISFIKEAGRKLGIGSAEATQPEGSAVPDTPTVDALKAEIKGLGLNVKDLAVDVHGDTVKVSGTAPDQATKEKLVVALGNVAGVAAVDESVAAEKAEPEAVIYVVKKGDTLSAIAQKHYGKASKYRTIFEANRPMLKDPDKIYPGQALRIPPEA